jgi:sterol desaturase/sphingolipid hydroxylase (fatty acid hydroxylase superfamily)
MTAIPVPIATHHNRSLACLAVVDAWYFFVHRWCHANRTAYRLLHAKHHEPTASLNAITVGYVDPVCALLEGGVPGLCAHGLHHRKLLASTWRHHTSRVNRHLWSHRSVPLTPVEWYKSRDARCKSTELCQQLRHVN